MQLSILKTLFNAKFCVFVKCFKYNHMWKLRVKDYIKYEGFSKK